MKQVLKTVSLLFCFVLGVFLASIYKELVGFTGSMGYVIAVLGAALAVVAGIIILVEGVRRGVKKVSAKVVI